MAKRPVWRTVSARRAIKTIASGGIDNGGLSAVAVRRLSVLSPSAVPAEHASDALWVVCLCADWCGVCREYRPLFAQVAHSHPQLRFAWVDIEDHADLADDFDVETFPTILVAGAAGTRFLGPLLPHPETLGQVLGALPAAQPSSTETLVLLAAVARDPEPFRP